MVHGHSVWAHAAIPIQHAATLKVVIANEMPQDNIQADPQCICNNISADPRFWVINALALAQFPG
jgi:hypothetical protein